MGQRGKAQSFERAEGAARQPLPSGYARRRPEKTVLHQVVRENLETFLAELREDGRGLPRYVEQEFRRFLRCGILEEGFTRCVCQECGDELLVAFSCKGKAFCPSCCARRMSDTAAHLVENVETQCTSSFRQRVRFALLLPRESFRSQRRCHGGRRQELAVVAPPRSSLVRRWDGCVPGRITKRYQLLSQSRINGCASSSCQIGPGAHGQTSTLKRPLQASLRVGVDRFRVLRMLGIFSGLIISGEQSKRALALDELGSMGVKRQITSVRRSHAPFPSVAPPSLCRGQSSRRSGARRSRRAKR